MPRRILDKLHGSEASRYVAHCSVMSRLRRGSRIRSSFAAISTLLMPVERYALPVRTGTSSGLSASFCGLLSGTREKSGMMVNTFHLNGAFVQAMESLPWEMRSDPDIGN